MRRILVATAWIAVLAASAFAGATGDHAILVVDPTNPDALRLANEYRAARRIPARNVLVMTPWSTGEYAELADRQLSALDDEIDARGLGHVGYVVLMPSKEYRVRARQLIEDTCSSVGHLALSSAYTTAFLRDRILAGNLWVSEPNHYWSWGTDVVAFDGRLRWVDGSTSTASTARRYLIGATLGYTGARGNTAAELVDLVERSVAADGTRPAGTFYFMETNDADRSGPREGQFPAVVTDLLGLGFGAKHLLASLPADAKDCLGIMTGSRNVDPVANGIVIRPGAFCDHMTSYAGRFEATGQTQVSTWIAAGASGSAGAVEEPCNYAGKFPHAKLHHHYARGLTLGESYFRSARYLPFQIMLYGDPLARPHAHVPVVSVDGLPSEPASGSLTIRPSATTTRPATKIAGYELLVDGTIVDSVGRTGSFHVDTTDWNDGHHEIRVLARDDSAVATVGRWIGSVTTANRGHAATISASPRSGNLGTAFRISVAASGRAVREVRVLQHGRVVATTSRSSDTLTVHGHLLGAGPVEVQAEALFEGGRRARSEPIALEIAAAGGGDGGSTPVAYGYRKVVDVDGTYLVELPATHADEPDAATFELVAGPGRATVLDGPEAGFRLLRVPAGASGEDAMTFRVTTPSGTSSVATVILHYGEETVEPDPGPDSEPVPVSSETLTLTVTRGLLKDREDPGRDKVKVKAAFEFLPEATATAVDPLTTLFVLEIGEAGSAYRLEIPAADPLWKASGGVWTYKRKVVDGPKVKLKIDARAGTLKLKASRLDLGDRPANPVRVRLALGDDEGVHEAGWTEGSSGKLELR